MMEERGQHTLAEILSQPKVWADALSSVSAHADALAQLWIQESFEQVIFTGCGSTYYLSEYGAVILQTELDIPVRAYPGSELALFPQSYFDSERNTLLIVVSRSGETTESIEAARLFRKQYSGKTLVVTNYSESTLAVEADMVVAIDSAREVSVAQTRSFSTMALAVEGIASIFAGRALDLSVMPSVVDRLISEHHDLARSLGEDGGIKRFFFLGSNILYGLACEAMLKMKEMSLSYSEAYHMLEFRHGPMSMVDDQTLVVGLLSDQAYRHEVAVLKDMKERGARILAIAEDADDELAAWADVVPLKTGLPLRGRAIAYLPVLQLMAYHRAIFNEQNPDKPANLSSVIVLDPLA